MNEKNFYFTGWISKPLRQYLIAQTT